MCTIIKIAPGEHGGHSIQSQSHRKGNWMGKDWIAVPEYLIGSLNGGYCELTIEKGVLAGVTPTERPVGPVSESATVLELVQQEITDLELSDIEQGQAITDLELMILEVRNV